MTLPVDKTVPLDKNFQVNLTRARVASKRSGAKTRVGSAYNIEGEYLTSTDVAERLQIAQTTARERLSKARKLPGPVTWEKLRGSTK